MLRSLWTPLFSVGRVKSYAAQEAEIASEHVENMLRKADGGPIRVNARASVTTLLVGFLTQCLHGVRLCDRMEPENVVVRLMKGVLREGVRYDRSYNWTLVYPFLKSFLPPFHTATLDSFHAYVQRLISDRAVAPATPTGAEGKSGKSDYTDMLLGIQRNVREPLGLGLNDLTATALELYFGVYDSTGTVLTLLLYYLALNPCAQEQVQEEVNADAEEGADGPESRQLPYLTACLNETMRLTPPFLRAERVCTRDWEAPGQGEWKGLRIRKNMRVMVPLFALHRDPKSFPNPEEFDPSRFMPENRATWNSYGFAPFGHGPKNCIGVKFTYETMKTVACALLRDFKVEAVEGVSHLEFKPGTLLAAQYEQIILNFVPRTNK